MIKGFTPVPPPTVSASVKRFKRTILDELKGLDDPRNKREPNHLLSDLVTIAILATLCGADNMVAVETYGREKQDWLASFLELPYGIPSHDTFSRVFATIDPEQFHGFFLRWVQQLTVQLDIKIINLDGKTARGSYDREESLNAGPSVTAWAAEHHLVLAQQRVDEKSNEITAIPELLDLLDVEGTIITIDAMGTQTEIAAQIIRNGGEYILALKGNQGKLHKGVKTFFEQAIAHDWDGIDYSYCETTEAGHHRIEHRSCWVVPISLIPNLPNHKKWKGLASIVRVRRRRILWNTETEQVSYYITSLAPDATLLAKAIRSHWGIENSLHWVLDVTFKEDQSRLRVGHGPENISLLRRLCVNLIKRDQAKGSINMKRYRAAMNNDYALTLLGVQNSES
ncbi:MAG: ISAs1 family transposase [Waterburya sp.]